MIDDFEKQWLAKFSSCLDAHVDKEKKKNIMDGSEGLSDNADRQKVIDWSRQAMEKLNMLVDEGIRIQIMTGCACQYPKSDLQVIRQKYEETKSIDLAHKMLHEKFLSFLKHGLELDNGMIELILSQGMGLAGHKAGNAIVAIKIPKSGYILEYFGEEDPVKKRGIYCHCPRIRDALNVGADISHTYCYCGAGYYKGIWEEILQEPVKVEVLESLLRGDDVCKIAIHLPL